MDNNMEISKEAQNYLNQLLHGTDTTSINMVRMNKLAFFNLASILRSRGLLKDSSHVSVEEQLLMFLHTVGHNQRNMVISHNDRYFNHVLWAIGQIQSDYIKPPSTSVSPYIARRPTLYPYFKDCIGGLDRTDIYASVPVDMVAQFRGRESFPTQNVLAAVDFDLCFTYVLAGWEGSADDVLVLQDALNRSNGLKVPEGKWYLVDAGYTTRAGFISPYEGVTYQSQGSRTPSNPKELFNYRHFSARAPIERAFGSLKSRFKILTSKPFFPLKTQVDIVLACCTLHNYILTMGADDLIPTEEEWVSQLETSATSMEQCQAHPECEPYNNEPIDVDDFLDIVFGNDQATGDFAKQTFDNLGQEPNAQNNKQDNTIVNFIAMNNNNNNEVMMTSNLANECTKIMQYDYTIQDAHRLFIYLNADNIKAREFLGATEMMRCLQVKDYLGPPGSQE